MKRIMLYLLILVLAWIIPTERVDIAQLRPVEVIAIYKNGDTVVMATDTEDMGVGSSAAAALENMRSTSPAIIYLDTAEYLLVEVSAQTEAETIRQELKKSVRICGIEGTIDLKSAAEYLPVHGDLPSVSDWNRGEYLPLLHVENDRLKIS